MRHTVTMLKLPCIGFVLVASSFVLLAQTPDIPAGQSTTRIDLPSSKFLNRSLPGSPTQINSLPMSLVVSPDGRYAATLNAGYGTAESKYDQSIVIVDLKAGKQVDFPDDRTKARTAHQTFFQGLAWGRDGKHLYASLASLTAPEGGKPGETGNSIAVYAVLDGTVTPERLIPIPLQQLASGAVQDALSQGVTKGMAIPYPSGLSIVPTPSDGDDRLLIADNLSDDALLLDTKSGTVVHRFDLASSRTVPTTYPITVTATRDGRRGFVALWNGSAIVELDLIHGRELGRVALLPPTTQTAPSSHPAAMALSPDEKTLYVALANRDLAAAVAVSSNQSKPLKVAAYFDTKLPGQTYFGAVPDGLALSMDGRWLFVANASSNAVAVYDTQHVTKKGKRLEAARPLGFIPTGWYPTALATTPGHLLITTAKGEGTGPNNMPQPGMPPNVRQPNRTYIGTLLHGSFASVDLAQLPIDLPRLTNEVVTDNRMKSAQEKIAFASGANPIRHIVYIIKENRTFDQILGDEATANGDPTLTMYGQSVTPNEHALAEQFGILDNFYDSAEVSGDGHVWSNAAITSDYTEKTWQQSYRGGERSYDYEGVVSNAVPLLQGIPDINEPASGYLWGNLARHGKTLYHFGEYITTEFCEERPGPSRQRSPLEGTPEATTTKCARPAIHKGEPLPMNYGGGVSPYPWAIPLIASNTATKPELRGHFDPNFPDFELSFPDQLRVEEFLTKFRTWKTDRENGHDTMPNFIQLRLPNDHTAGTSPGMPTPSASIADNDLAVGRAVEAISQSDFWNDTAFFILEDDAQDGADHVDAHRSICLVVSKYAPRTIKGHPFVDHRFYTTVSTIRTMETLLGLPPMNNNDAFAPLMAPLFEGAGDQPAYSADLRNRDNGLIYRANASNTVGAKESAKMDFSHADQAPTAELNVILWKDAKGSAPLPEQLRHPAKDGRRKDDDD